jgi:hypothetical protein
VVRIPLLRTSERLAFMDCEWRWYQEYVLGLTNVRQPTWSWFGSAMHKGLEVRYPVGRKRGHPADAIDAFKEALGGEIRRMYAAGYEPDEEEVVDGEALGVAMLEGYFKEYGLDQHWEVIHSEQTFQIDVPDWRNPDRIIAVYCGTWDLIVYDRHRKRYYVVDHKTRRSFPTNWGFYDLNTQGGSYLWVAPEVLVHMGIFTKGNPRHHLSGIIFNCLRKALPDARPRNAEGLCTNLPKKADYLEQLDGVDGWDYESLGKKTVAQLESIAVANHLQIVGEPSAKQPGPLFHRHLSERTEQQRVRQALYVQEEVKRMHRVRRGIDLPTKNTGENCTRCPMYDMCTLDEQDPLQAAEYRDAVLMKRDPYKDHKRDMRRGGVHVAHTAAG